VSAYDLDGLGWLLFERLATDAVERELAVPASAWEGSADALREAVCDRGVPAAGVPQAAVSRMVWVRGTADVAMRLEHAAAEDTGRRSLVLVVNVDEEAVPDGLAARVLDRRWLSDVLERSGELRLAHPSALGMRAGGPHVPFPTPSFDTAAAAALARVFVPVRAHTRALATLRAHRFVVLTGPPEMGKTAIARMIALALATDGWEAHECIRPEDVWRALDTSKAQVFVADDAFGSTEFRPDAGERWAREMERLLRSLDDRHWLIWTSRPAPLHAGLARIHRERGAERFPRPAEVVVDASALDRAEKALILFRHARAAGAARTTAANVLRAHGDAIVEDPHFTPERIRRFAAGRLFRLDADPLVASAVRGLLREELREPTTAMAASFAALDPDHRAVLVALLDCPPGPVAERDLAAAARRHARGGLRRAPAELTDRLADHFLRVADARVAWVHPSWRDLVIDALAADAPARRAFLSNAGLDGVLLALSVAGGRRGERAFPLLVDDADWDLVTDRVAALARAADEHDTLRLLTALGAAIDAEPPGPALAEARAVARALLGTVRRCFDSRAEPPEVAEIAAWLDLAALAGELDAPDVERTWFALLPGIEPPATAEELRLAEEWLWLVEVLYEHRPGDADRLGFPKHHAKRLRTLVAASGPVPDDDATTAALRHALHRRLAALPLPHPVVILRPDPSYVRASARVEVARDPAPVRGEGTVARILRDL
jgi:hypothetical protein